MEASSSAAPEEDDSCKICLDRPRTVRNLPCSHAVFCELCAIETMQPAQRSLRCPTCRNDVDVLQLEMRSADAGDGGPPRPKRMRSFEPETQPGARVFESLQAFLEAMRDSEAPEVAEKAGEVLARWGVAEQEEEQEEEEEEEEGYRGGAARRRCVLAPAPGPGAGAAGLPLSSCWPLVAD